MKNKLKQLSGSWYFFLVIVLFYFILLIFRKDLFFLSLGFFWKIILKVFPIFIIVFVLIALSNYFVTPQFFVKHFKQKGIKKWIFVIIGGIISSGPIYMWYPLLANLREKGLNYGLIACFLYNRAIKIPLIPIMLIYFDLKYILILGIVMIFMSVIQGIFLNKLMGVKK